MSHPVDRADLSSPTAPDDDALLARAVAGDGDSLSTLLARFGPLVRNGLITAIGAKWQSAIDADDVMQITYIEAFLRIRQFKPNGVGSFLAWLRRVADNNMHDAIKGLSAAKRPQPDRRVTSDGSTSSAESLIQMLGADTTTPSRVAAGAESRAILDRALAQMPPDYANVLRLYDLECRPVGDVAAAMNRSTGAIYMLRARAVDQLRLLLPAATAFFSRPG